MRPSNRLKNENSMYLYINKNADIKFSVYECFRNLKIERLYSQLQIMQKSLGAIKPKALNRIAKFGLRYENVNFD